MSNQDGWDVMRSLNHTIDDCIKSNSFEPIDKRFASLKEKSVQKTFGVSKYELVNWLQYSIDRGRSDAIIYCKRILKYVESMKR